MAIIAVTVGAQIIIVNFGGIVFRLNPLDLAGWAVSVALGTGSIVVGYLLRHLPDVNVPVWLLGGGGVSTSSAPESAPKIVINPVEEETITVSETKISPRNRWDAALKKTKMQNKVIRVFRLPSNHSLENIAQHAQLQKLENIAERTEASSPSYWERLRLYIVTIGAFRQRRGDPSDTLLIDPRRYHNARVQLAKQRSKNQVTQ